MGDLIIWAHGETPSIDCPACGVALVKEPNGNAPLVFTLHALTRAWVLHSCVVEAETFAESLDVDQLQPGQQPYIDPEVTS